MDALVLHLLSPSRHVSSSCLFKPMAQPVVVFSIEQAEAELLETNVQEQGLELELEKLYSRATHLCQSESQNLTYIGEQHRQVPQSIKKLQDMLLQTSGVADELSGRVRKLDTICGRITDALKFVDDMLELRECADQVMKTIQNEEFEQAAKYVSRFRACQGVLPPGIDDASIRVLKQAEEQLSVIVRKRFEEAMSTKDQASISRFAKLFPSLGLSGEGVKKYLEFIRHSLAEKCAVDFKQLVTLGKRADTGPTPYAEVLTNLFVAIADIVQEHQQAVEEEFGPENFVVVVRGMLLEADVQGLRVLDKFKTDNNNIFEKLGSGMRDMHELSAVLEETALLTQRTHQFDSWIRGVAAEVIELLQGDARIDFEHRLPQNHNQNDGLVELTVLMQRVQELVSSYVCIEQSFLLNSVERALAETDSLDPDDPEQLTTTMVDDAFYILRESLRRAITTGDINAVCAVVNHVSGAVSQDVKKALVDSLQESQRSYRNWLSHTKNIAPPQAGAHPLATLFLDKEGKLRAPLKASLSWPHSINNLQQCIEYLDRLKVFAEATFDEYFPEDIEKRTMFHQVLSGLDEAKTELENMHVANCKSGLDVLKQQHLSPMLSALNTLSYELSEVQYDDIQVNDPFVKAFISQVGVVHQHLKAVLNSVSCDEMMQQMAGQTCKRIENTVFSKTFTIFGALQLDTEVRALCSYFTTVSEQALRHKFARLLEMSSLLNLESISELKELCAMSEWRLTHEEMHRLISSRTDFDATEAELKIILH